MEAIFEMSSLATTISSEKANLDTLTRGTRAYFQARLKNRLYNLVLTKFRQKADAGLLTKAQLARRMGRQPEVISRLLGAPGNWTLDIVSDLLLAISGEELDATSSDPEKKPSRNARSADGHPADPAMEIPVKESSPVKPRIENAGGFQTETLPWAQLG